MFVELSDLSPDDVALLHEMLLELAASDGVAHVDASVDAMRAALFGPMRAATAQFIRVDTHVAGFVMHSWKWGTFTGVRDLYLHALFVTPAHRRHGVARRAMSLLARMARDAGCSRIEWLTVRAKDDTRRFYDAIGATSADHMTVRRVGGFALEALASAT